MNNTKIDWCDMSWNPVTGCLHGCEYCYARRQTHRFAGHMDLDFIDKHPNEDEKTLHELDEPLVTYDPDPRRAPYPFDFEPTLLRYKLDEPARKTDGVKIFVCSMSDLFGEWVPDEWIEQVFKACKAAPQHRYLFLTKNPQRYLSLEAEKKLPWSGQFWFGTSVTNQNDSFAWFKEKKFHWFVSIEPLLTRIEITEHDILPEWVIIGPETGRRRDKVIPQREWVEEIVSACRARSVPVFMKSKLVDIWGEDLIREFPPELEGEVVL